MPLFEVTLSDGSTSILQAHNKTELKQSLQGVKLVRSIRYCKECRKSAATVQNTLCQSCWDKVLAFFRNAWKDLEMSEEELQCLSMSFFVDG